MDEGYKIWVNTISGNDFEIVRNKIPVKILSTFIPVIISNKLNPEEALKIAKSEGIEQLPFHYDGNIGSIFYDIKQVKERYDRLDNISKLLLLVVKQLYSVGIYFPPSQILKSNVRALFDTYEPDITNESISKKIEGLIKNGFLLDSTDPKSLCFEEKYLRIVVEPYLEINKYLKFISEIFPKNAVTYTQAMQSAINFTDANKIYQQMRTDGIQPGIQPFFVLMSKANDSDIGLDLIKEMDKLEINPDENMVNLLLRSTHGD